MYNRKIVAAALLWLLMDVAATAQTIGNEVYGWCGDNRSMVTAYAAGVSEHSARLSHTLGLVREAIKGMPADQIQLVNRTLDVADDLLVGYCISDQVTLEQLTDVFCSYLKDTPEQRRTPATFLFRDAMRKAWPCPKAH
jgi:hypothetical protein